MSPILDVVAPRLLAPAIMLAMALIVKGYADVGEGFSAGVIVRSGGRPPLRDLGRWTRRPHPGPRPPSRRHRGRRAVDRVRLRLRRVALGQPPFTHLPLPGEAVISIGRLELTTAVGFDVGLFLLVVGSLVCSSGS